LDRFGLTEFFAVVVVREDAPLKPNPAPITRACTELGVTRAWMIGDTRDDIVAARAANALPIGVVPPGDPPDDIRASLTHAGAARVLASAMEVRACLS
ncbi:MAG TPA: HAD-IA family hydrolase, partial [Gemmatimonadaceae bacterium]|nr:HAD-IA family hydrolase [Gemmatimonadaceae bacterium]